MWKSKKKMCCLRKANLAHLGNLANLGNLAKLSNSKRLGEILVFVPIWLIIPRRGLNNEKNQC